MIPFETNEVLKRLPAHIMQFVNEQNYDNYSPIDQAVWRYVMRKNTHYLSNVAHESYLIGLKKAGISIENIPSMYGMNRILKEMGWAAVAVDGFIPPNAFMEFQAYNVLVIAEDIRKIENIEYTPAPDIIHEAAGHAPIITNPEYAEYLRRFGEIGAKAISSFKDYELYEAIRHLSIVKEDRNSTEAEITEAENKVAAIQENMGEPSEMARIRNLHWWTVEYGLIGTTENPKIYGAGLLSSIGESKWCMQPQVKKIVYSIDAADVAFDITKPQPQLFVTPDFAHLSFVLEQFANQMSLRRGGLRGIEKLIESKQLGTVEYNTGLQISGVFTEVISDEYHQPVYIKTTGKTALSFRDKELTGHGITYHSEGFGSPIGKLKYINTSIENMSPYDLEAYKIREGQYTRLEFEGNIIVEGEIITGVRSRMGKILLISFKNCTVKHNDTILFQPDWGVYDMAIGEEIVSCFAGPADANSFDLVFHVPSEKTHKQNKSEDKLWLESLYLEVRKYREKESKSIDIENILSVLKTKFPEDWLLSVELFEIAVQESLPIADELHNYLLELKDNSKVPHLIEDGIEFAKIKTN